MQIQSENALHQPGGSSMGEIIVKGKQSPAMASNFMLAGAKS